MPWSSVKGLLFDVDGTLTHSDDLHFKAFADLLQKPEWEINGVLLPNYLTSTHALRLIVLV